MTYSRFSESDLHCCCTYIYPAQHLKPASQDLDDLLIDRDLSDLSVRRVLVGLLAVTAAAYAWPSYKKPGTRLTGWLAFSSLGFWGGEKAQFLVLHFAYAVSHAAKPPACLVWPWRCLGPRPIREKEWTS